MGKQRFTALDVKASVDEIRHMSKGMRLLNVYDLSPRVYLFKFGQGEKKVHVLFESGVRLHVTNFAREKPKVPSQFTLKLRKHVRSWRLEDVRQVGADRVVDFQFGAGDQSFHFVLEVYGQGNFFLTDARYCIMMLLRSSKSEDVRLAVKELYPIEAAKPYTVQTLEDITAALTEAKDSDSLRACLPLSAYGTLSDHMLASCGLNAAEKKRVWEDDIAKVASSVFNVCAAVDAIMSRPILGEGTLVRLHATAAKGGASGASKATPATAEPSTPASTTLSTSSQVTTPDEFWPAVFEPFLDKSRIAQTERTLTFSEAADRCFRGTEQEKIDSHNIKKEQVVVSKKEKFLRDHQRRIDGLMAEQDRNRQLGELIQANVQEVDMAINLVNDVLSTGMSWEALGSLIRVRQAEGHPIANIIHELKLYKNTISILLSQDCADDDEVEDADLEPIVVDVDIGLSAYANAAKYHAQKKTVAKKLERTIESTDKASEAAEKKGERIAQKVVDKRDIINIRVPMWFEKFHWFLTSLGHIVVAGHDPTQADMLFKRYWSQGDIFVHCDAPNALPALVKNPNNGSVPLPSVEEAGIMCISRTEAWKKAPVSAWWCIAAQVSKKMPNADHQLAPGQFSVRGPKNYMPAMQLQLAVAVLFRTNRLRPVRETGSAISFINVAESLKASAVEETAATQQQQQQSQPRQKQVSPSCEDSLNATSSSLAAPPIATLRQGSQDMEERQTSGDTTNTDPQSPTARDDAEGERPFPTGTTPPPAGAPLSKKLKHLRRGQGSAHSTTISESGDGGSETLTISLASTRTAPTKPTNARLCPGTTPTSVASPVMPQAAPPPPPSSRTQTKLKKIRKKYAEQDDEDRQRAMALIGNPMSKVHQEYIQAVELKKHHAAQQQLADAAAAQGDSDESHDLGATDDEADAANVAGSSGKQVTFAKSRGNTETFDETAMEREHEEMNRRASSFDDDTVRMQERIQIEASSILPYLDGCPSVADDVQVEDVVLMCAPYASVRHYAIKTRIAPGNEKKGSASSSILHAFLQEISAHVPGANTAAKQLTADMLIGQLPGTIKIHRAETGIGAAAALKSTTKDDGLISSPAAPNGPPLTAKQIAQAKKEQAARNLEEKLRAERKARQEAKMARQEGHADPAADLVCV